MPYSHHPYAYALSNPVLYTDAAGICAVMDDGEDCHRPQHNPRDLTEWLYREMKHNLDDPRLQNIRSLNHTPFFPTCVVKAIGGIPMIISPYAAKKSKIG